MTEASAEAAAPERPEARILDTRIQLVSAGHRKHVLARFGATVAGAGPDRRPDPAGNFIPGRAKQKGAAAPVFIEGKFFE